MTATNFEEFVKSMTEEAPHAVVLDWYRRLELMMRDYLASRGLRYRNGKHAASVAKGDPLLGVNVASVVDSLRLIRNQVAHTSQGVTAGDATKFARQSLTLIGQFWHAKDLSANRQRCTGAVHSAGGPPSSY
jgi:hypothetical protein